MAEKRHDHCCVPLCSNDSRYDDDHALSFHAFPKDDSLRKQWIVAIRRDIGPNFKITTSTRVCSTHFTSADLKKTLNGRRVLVKGAIPSCFSWTNRSKKPRKSPKKRFVDDGGNSGLVEEDEYPESSAMDMCSTAHPDHDYLETDELSMDVQLQQANAHIEKLESQVCQLKACLFSAQRFSADPDMIRFYTGFNTYELFLVTFKALEPTATNMLTWAQVQRQITESSTPRETTRKYENLLLIDQFFLFLCRCKCGLFEKDIAARFNISVSTTSRIIITWANYLYYILGALPIWPSRQAINTFLPDCFKELYPNTRVILDCTELKCQTPSSLYINSQMYSHYKSNTTFKGLVGITPSGAVSFVSQLYSGSISDVNITAQSGILDLLEEGDDVMADKGFTIGKLLESKNATLNIPPFLTNKRSQFTKEEVEATQSIARVRIHVERAIRRIKEFHIFDGVISLSLAGSINQIWTVCALLTNFRGPLF